MALKKDEKELLISLLNIQRSQRFCPVTVTVPSPSRHRPVPRRSKSSNVLKRPKASLTVL